MDIRSVGALGHVPAAAWDALVPPDNPFLEHGFLAALESSGSVGTPETGWVPQHLVAYVDGTAIGAMPLYLKFDSYGEYIFDWAWAQAAMQAGLVYYPKLVSAVPFTPATGSRLLLRPDLAEADRRATARALVHASQALAVQLGASSVHVLFTEADVLAPLTDHGFVARLSQQFHWHRQPHWHHFDDYLTSLRAPARKQVRRERKAAQSAGLRLSMRNVAELSAADWQAMQAFYRQTVDEKGAIAYLTPAFFTHLRTACAPRVWVAMAHAGDTAVAGALYLTRGTHLYGRYWGCLAQYDALHFELCYYMPIAWGLAHGIQRFEAGAQGEHKLKRGLLPAACHSAHWLRHAGLAAGVGRFVVAEAAAVRANMAAQMAHTPFHRSAQDAPPTTAGG